MEVARIEVFLGLIGSRAYGLIKGPNKLMTNPASFLFFGGVGG